MVLAYSYPRGSWRFRLRNRPHRRWKLLPLPATVPQIQVDLMALKTSLSPHHPGFAMSSLVSLTGSGLLVEGVVTTNRLCLLYHRLLRMKSAIGLDYRAHVLGKELKAIGIDLPSFKEYSRRDTLRRKRFPSLGIPGPMMRAAMDQARFSTTQSLTHLAWRVPRKTRLEERC